MKTDVSLELKAGGGKKKPIIPYLFYSYYEAQHLIE